MDSIWTYLLEIIKIAVPGALVVAATWVVVKHFTQKEYDLKMVDLRMKNQKTLTPMRLQAYERLTLFIERISPQNLIPRIRKSEMNAKELQIQLVQTIRQEYEHNLAQQIYVSNASWDAVSIVKDETIKVINLIAASMPTETDSLQFSRAILEFYMKEEVMPAQRAMDILKAEVRQLF